MSGNALTPRAPNGTAGFRIRAGTVTTLTLPAGHDRLRTQNIRLGIADIVTEPASAAAPIGGYARGRRSLVGHTL